MQNNVIDEIPAAQHNLLNLSLRAIANRFASLLDEDIDNPNSTPIQQSVSNISLALNDLFDFERSFWKEFKPSISIGSIDDELATYSLDVRTIIFTQPQVHPTKPILDIFSDLDGGGSEVSYPRTATMTNSLTTNVHILI